MFFPENVLQSLGEDAAPALDQAKKLISSNTNNEAYDVLAAKTLVEANQKK